MAASTQDGLQYHGERILVRHCRRKVNESPRITIRFVSLAALALTGLFLRPYSFMETMVMPECVAGLNRIRAGSQSPPKRRIKRRHCNVALR